MATTKKLWKLEPHTQGKHFVLKSYLDAWLPILGSWNGRILFIDGFAGPGEYEGGEDGSPIIALKAFLDHKAKTIIKAEVVYIFIEREKKRAEHLQALVSKWQPKLPERCKVQIIQGVFDEQMKEVLNYIEAQNTNLAPSFVMIDPFGVSGTPMDVISRIFKNPRCEVYISFMFESINRFKNTPEFTEHLDALFGCQTWRDGIGLTDFNKKKDFFYDLYEAQLRKAGAQYVIHFDLYEGNRLVYAIFFGTQNLIGCDRMKSAIWKVDSTGNFTFRGTRSGQLTIDFLHPNLEPLKQALQKEFVNKGWVNIKQVIDFVISDKTDYCSTQVRKSVLVPMEIDGEIKINEATRNRKRTFPSSTYLRFLGG